jgi:protein TonB
VTLLLLVDETGQVHECSVVDARPEGIFEEAALGAFRSARFSPGRKDGRNVRSRVLVKVVFNPDQATSAATR